MDSTGIKFLGDGEWQARKHGVQGGRRSRNVHLAMDAATSDIRAVDFTSSSDGDRPILPAFLNHIPEGEDIGTVTADSAYHTRRCLTTIIDRWATAIIPIRKNGRPWKADCAAAIAKNETQHTTRHYSRAFWKRWTGYQNRSSIEATMQCECLHWTHRTNEPLLGPRNGRDRSRGVILTGKGVVMPQA